MPSRARTFVVVALLACGDLASAQPIEAPSPRPETASQAAPEDLPPLPPLPQQEPHKPPREVEVQHLPRFALRALGGIGAASAVQGNNDIGPVLDVVLEWWPEPWEPPPPGWRSTPWATSWSAGLAVHWNTFTNHITGAPQAGVSSTSTVWEPHVDVAAGNYLRDGSWLARLRFGVGAYIGTATSSGAAAQPLSTQASGGAIRLGFGIIAFPEAPVGFAIEWAAEGGWIGSSAVGSVQFLIGPSFHLGRQ